MKGKIVTVLTLAMVFAMLVSPVLAAPAPPKAPAPPAGPAALIQSANAGGPARYFVVLSDPSVPSNFDGVAGFEATAPAANGKVKLDATSPESQAYAAYLQAQQDELVAEASQMLGRSPEVVYQFQFALNAVVMVLEPAEAEQLTRLPGVALVIRDVAEQVATDYGPTWIGAPGIWNGTATGGLPGTKGESIIVGVMDSGINVDHPSFADVGGDGYNHTNPFGAGVYKGWCNSGYPVTVTCNDKLVGAWDYSDASWGETDGPEDNDGHGSNVASISIGNVLLAGTVNLTPFNYSPAISGVAPHANVIAYDVCGPTGSCYNTDVVAAINQAILDGVDVLNESIGISGDTWTGGKQAAYLSAFNAGIVASRSAGNSGPNAGTVGTEPPWTIASGASTHNRAGANAVTNLSGGSTSPPGGGTLNGLGFSGSSIVAPIVYAANAPYNDALCLNPFAAGSAAGKIVVCDRGTNARVAKGWNVLQGGAVGMVLVNTAAGQSMNGDVHHLPAVQLNPTNGTALKTWLASGAGHQGSIAGATISTAPSNGDIMAGFSSRGPHPTVDVIKPDITSPGVDIIGAYRTGAIGPEDPTSEYGVISGTSQASPHTAGSAALIRALHPTWTPAEVKSALMNTGKVTGVVKENGTTQADPFDLGGGRTNLLEAGIAGLILNETGAAFAAANPGTGGDPKTLNLASMANSACAGICTWTRTVKATRVGTWTASYTVPAGMTLSVVPANFTLNAGQTQQIVITANVTGLPVGAWAFGYVALGEGSGASVHFPVAVKPIASQAAINVTPSSLAAIQAANTTTSQTLNVGNTGVGDLIWTIFEDATGAAPELADWSDNFDSYATGSQLHGQGGWKGWFNDPTAGALASNAQARSAPNSAAIVGASDLVHEYAETDGQWVYTAWQYLPANFTGQSYFILLNTYNDAGSGLNWSTQLCFDAASGLLYDDIPGDCSGTSTLPLVTGQWVQIRVEINLDADTQAIYYNNQLLVQDTWSGHVSGGGATTIAAVDLFANGASTIYYDDLSLVASAQPVACDAPADIPWVNVSPTNGTTPAAGSSPVTVTFDSTGLANGTYTGNLCVDSNDPDPGPGNGTDLVIVPLTLTVQEPTAVTLSGLAADDTSPAPMPVSVPMSALPAAVAAAFAVMVALRRRR